MQKKTIKIKDVFKSTSSEEIDKHLKEKILKIMMNQQKLETSAV